MEQKFTIVRTCEVFRRVDGEIQSSNEDSIYPGFANDAETAIGDLIEQLAEEEDEDSRPHLRMASLMISMRYA